MSSTFLQFGTSRFLQAHADLMLSEARADGQPVGAITIVETTGSPASRSRIAEFSKAQPIRINIRGLQDGVTIDEDRWVTGIQSGISARESIDALVESFLNARYILSNTADTGYRLPTNPANTLDGWTSFPELLTALLYHRYKAGGEPPVLMPCELIARNGDTLRALVLGLARDKGIDFANWIEERCIFVNSLVDRIVAEPLFPIGAVAEPYALWAMESQPGFVPPCNHRQIDIVDDLDAIERRKLFILNLGHTLLAQHWLDAGSRPDALVGEAMADRQTFGWLETIMTEDVLPGFGGQSHSAACYWQTCIERFSNPFLAHRLSDIATNHGAKIERRARGFIDWAKSNGSSSAFSKLRAALPTLDQ